MSLQPRTSNKPAEANNRIPAKRLLGVAIGVLVVTGAIFLFNRKAGKRTAALTPPVQKSLVPQPPAAVLGPSAPSPVNHTAKTNAAVTGNGFVKRKVQPYGQQLKPQVTRLPSALPDIITDNGLSNARMVLQSFLAQTAAPRQLFTFNAGQAQVFTATAGTRISIPANAFIDRFGQPVTGNITIEVKEAYQYGDMIANGLGTAGPMGEILVTGGMIYTAARQNGDALQVMGGKRIGIEMPAARFDKDMQLFIPATTYITGNSRNDTVIYELQSSAAVPAWQPAAQFQWRPATGNFVFTPHDGRTAVLNMKDEPYKITGGRKTRAYFTLSKDSKFTPEAAVAELKRRYGKYYDDIRVKQSKRFGNGGKSLFAGEDFYEVIGDSIRVTVPDAIRLRYIDAADSMVYERKRSADSLRHFYRQIYDNYFSRGRATGVASRKIISDTIDYIAWYEKFKREREAEARQLEKMNAYTFETGRLGWINCDRFYNYPGQSADFIVQLPGNNKIEALQSCLVFKDIRSLYRNSSYHHSGIMYPNLPVGMEVYVIVMGVINGQVHAGIESAQTGSKPFTVPALQPVTPGQFKAQMAVITGSSAPTAAR